MFKLRLPTTNPAFLLRAVLVFFMMSSDASATPGHLSGKVTINGVTLPNVVLYLHPENGETPAPRPMTLTIAQEDLQFSPAFSIVTAGSTILFENRDDHIHNIRSKSPSNSFNLGSHLPKTTKSVLLKNSGVVSLKCKVHPEMNGLIYVSPTKWFGVTDGKGRFEIKDVPPGNYLLESWHQSFTRRELVGNTQKVRIGPTTKPLSLALIARGGLSREMKSHGKQNWLKEVQAVDAGLQEALSKWQRKKKRSAVTKIMRTYSARYMESGLRNAIAKNLGEPRALNQEAQFDQIRKGIQGFKGPLDLATLEGQIDTLVFELEQDVLTIKNR